MSNYGVVLDVDGVLVRGSKVIPQALPALQMLHDASIPVLFVTNSGNVTEAIKAERLSEQLGFDIREDQVILSHTPWKDLVPLYRRKRVLIVGTPASMDVARAYGFENLVSPECCHRKMPDIYPVKPVLASAVAAEEEEGIEAAFIFSDSIDWGLHIQVLTDALLDSKHEVGESFIPVFACNADVVYTGTHHLPRFTQGAFIHAFQALFNKYTGHDAPIQFCGKPFPMQYRYAEKLFHNNASRTGNITPAKFYGVGDNPRSDIRGANMAGDHWTSILVKTGVFKGDLGNDKEDPADDVVDDVLDAVVAIIKRESAVS